MLLPALSALIWYATWLLSEKDIVWPFDPTPWVEGVAMGKIFATTLLPASSALIWFATWPYSEKVSFWPRPHPLSPPNGLGPRPSNWNPVCYVSYLLLLCLHAKFQQKILTIALVIAKFKYLTFDPLGGVKGGVQDNSAQNQLGPCQLGPHKTRPMPTRPKMQNSAHETRPNLSFINI